MEKFNQWIRQHKLFAVAAPIVLLLLIFFVTTSISSINSREEGLVEEGGYNNFLPGQENELKVEDPNSIFKKSQQDSLDALRKHGLFNNIVETKKKNDSLERILQELDNFSLDDSHLKSQEKLPIAEVKSRNNVSEYVDKKNEVQQKLEYRKLMLDAREERQARSQDYSAPRSNGNTGNKIASVNLEAAIYRDQFILPGSRVTLIIREDVHFNGKVIPKNTFIYAQSNIKGSRVLLEITNINKISWSLHALDKEDGMIGLYNERAGELLQEFIIDNQVEAIDELSNSASEVFEKPLANNLVRSFGNFFKKKKYRQNQKILLVNGDKVVLKPKG